MRHTTDAPNATIALGPSEAAGSGGEGLPVQGSEIKRANNSMKTMTCKELGGACGLEFHADTFEEIAQMSQQHGKEMLQKGDKAHVEAMSKMRDLMQSEDGMARWMAEKRKEFDSKPDEK
jgi:predicted small metal-binding protein